MREDHFDGVNLIQYKRIKMEEYFRADGELYKRINESQCVNIEHGYRRRYHLGHLVESLRFGDRPCMTKPATVEYRAAEEEE